MEVSFKEFCDEMGTFPPLPAQSIEEGSYVLVKSAVDTGKCKRAQVARTNKLVITLVSVIVLLLSNLPRYNVCNENGGLHKPF